jgi:ketosteroid isomerase-like protein
MTPDVISRYFEAVDSKDPDRMAACFAEDAVVHDENETIQGRAAIRQWRVDTAEKYQYTATVTGSDQDGAAYLVRAHIVGTFPGAEADLTYRFGLRDGLIDDLSIVP